MAGCNFLAQIFLYRFEKRSFKSYSMLLTLETSSATLILLAEIDLNRNSLN